MQRIIGILNTMQLVIWYTIQMGNYITKLTKFGYICFCCRRRLRCHRHHALFKCLFHVTDTNAHIKFILYTVIEWKNPIDFDENRKKNGWWWPFCEHMLKKLVTAITSSEMHPLTSLTCQGGRALSILASIGLYKLPTVAVLCKKMAGNTILWNNFK